MDRHAEGHAISQTACPSKLQCGCSRRNYSTVNVARARDTPASADTGKRSQVIGRTRRTFSRKCFCGPSSNHPLTATRCRGVRRGRHLSWRRRGARDAFDLRGGRGRRCRSRWVGRCGARIGSTGVTVPGDGARWVVMIWGKEGAGSGSHVSWHQRNKRVLRFASNVQDVAGAFC